MNSSLKSVLEYEKKVTDLEEKLHIPGHTPSTIKQVIWLSDDPADVWPLIASLTNEPESVIVDALLKRKARCLPLILNYSKSFKIELFFDKTPKNKKFRLLEDHGIDREAIISVASEGVVRLGSDEEPPFVLDNSVRLLNFLMELLIDEPDDMCQSLKSIHAEGPFERIQGMKIIVHPESKLDFIDVAWLTVSNVGNSDIKKNAAALIQKTNAHVIIPLIILNGENTPQTRNETVATKHLINCIKDLEQSLKVFSDRIVYPPLLLNRTWFKQKAKERSYEDDFLGLIWTTTRISGLNTAINHRLKTMTDFVIEKPTSILGMMHKIGNLKILNSFPDIELHYPDLNEFSKLREQGIKKYPGVSTPIAEPEKAPEKISPEKILEAPTKPRSAVFIENTVQFLNELTSTDLCKAKHKDFKQFAEKLGQKGSSWSDEKLNTLVTNIDDLLNQVWQSLDDIDITLKSTLHDLKGRLAPIDEQSIPFAPEYVDKVKFFWGDFFQLSLKKMKLKSPTSEIKEICSSSTKKFLNLISRTPPDEKEFKKNLKDKWPAFVKNTVKHINNVLEDTSQIWELKVKDVLMKLEDFRKENLPNETKISPQIPMKLTRKPTIAETLNVQIKKPGFIKMFMSQSEKENWRKDTILKISQEVKKIMKQYEVDILKWITSLENSTNLHISGIQKAGTDSLKALEKSKTQTEKMSGETKTLRRDIDKIKSNIVAVSEKINHYNVLKKNWIDIKEKYSYN